MRARGLWTAGVTFGALAGAALVGCVVLSGSSTNGYVLEDAGTTTSSTSSCSADGGVCIDIACASRADCDAGLLCCLGATDPVGFTCQSACGEFAVQACKADTECGDAGACTIQECTLSGATFSTQLCGLAAGCTAVVAGDAGG